MTVLLRSENDTALPHCEGVAARVESGSAQAVHRVLAAAQRLAESHCVKAAEEHVADRPLAEGIIATAVDLG